jgi:hypothetical protein
MPRCHIGNHSVPAEELRRVGEALACSACRKLKGVEGEEPMGESKKSVVFLNISEIERSTDGHTSIKDHKIEAQIGLGSLNLKWDVTFDQIRDFFTKRREIVAKKKNPLTSV